MEDAGGGLPPMLESILLLLPPKRRSNADQSDDEKEERGSGKKTMAPFISRYVVTRTFRTCQKSRPLSAEHREEVHTVDHKADGDALCMVDNNSSPDGITWRKKDTRRVKFVQG